MDVRKSSYENSKYTYRLSLRAETMQLSNSYIPHNCNNRLPAYKNHVHVHNDRVKTEIEVFSVNVTSWSWI